MIKSVLVGTAALLGAGLVNVLPVMAAPPPILLSAKNQVPACVTPERLLEFTIQRNTKLATRFKPVAELYAKHGQELGVRWDYAFYQMLVETNWLRFHRPNGKPGDVDASQNNLAGIAATGKGVPGERYESLEDGVLAHLGHIRLYSGNPIDNPVAKRTRDVEGIILPWARAFKRPVTFTDLTTRWATSKTYARAIESVAERFRNDYCNGRVEIAAREPDKATGTDSSPQRQASAQPAMVKARSKTIAAGVVPAAPSMSEEAKPIDPNQRMGAGLAAVPDSGPMAPADEPVKLASDGAALPNVDTGRSDTAQIVDSAPEGKVEESKVAVLTPPAAPEAPTPAVATACKVFTASFGGGRSMLIESIEDGTRRLTALTVQEGKEDAQSAAFMNVHAPSGQSIGSFATPDEALAKAFELCPEK